MQASTPMYVYTTVATNHSANLYNHIRVTIIKSIDQNNVHKATIYNIILFVPAYIRIMQQVDEGLDKMYACTKRCHGLLTLYIYASI